MTQQTSETVHAGLDDTGATVEQTDYTYNLQGRMATATVDLDNDGTVDSFSEYEYDDSGIRVAASEEVDANDDGDLNDQGDRDTRTEYLVDHRNPTGYAQVLEEMLDPDGDGTAQATLQKSYTVGHDVFLEAVASNQIRRLLKDGHGSTRALVDALGNVIQSGSTPQIFAYDAYGNPLGFSPSLALTTHLYSGEQTDQLTGLQYLRARYYNPATGTFNRLDPFAGNFSDPQSLHKYLYTHADPVNFNDPTGNFEGLVGMLAAANFQTVVSNLNIMAGQSAAASMGFEMYGGFSDVLLSREMGFLPISVYNGIDATFGYIVQNAGDLGLAITVVSTTVFVGSAVPYSHFVKSFGAKLARQQRALVRMLTDDVVAVMGDSARTLLNKVLPAHDFPVKAIAHHIFPVHLFDTPLGKKLHRWGIDLNGMDNGVYLPRFDYDGRTASLHTGGHMAKYYDEIEEALMDAGNADEAIDILDKYREKLLTTKGMLQHE